VTETSVPILKSKKMATYGMLKEAGVDKRDSPARLVRSESVARKVSIVYRVPEFLCADE
jgi:hypothetical protein